MLDIGRKYFVSARGQWVSTGCDVHVDILDSVVLCFLIPLSRSSASKSSAVLASIRSKLIKRFSPACMYWTSPPALLSGWECGV